MGIHDRSYYRDEAEANLAFSWNQRSAIAIIIIVNVAVFVASMVLRSNGRNLIVDWFALVITHWYDPQVLWRLLTYGFVHNPGEIWHVLMNMFGLWMLGRAVEDRYGRNEFFRIYLICIVACGLGWLLIHHDETGSLIGASGAVSCIEMLFILNFPRTILMLFGVAPIPAWVFGAFLILSNMVTSHRITEGPKIAYDVHLIGIGFALVYFFFHWNFSILGNITSRWKFFRRKWTGPKLKVHQAKDDQRPTKDDTEADRILQKIHESGQDSLTGAERRFMETYSRRVRKRRENQT